MARCLPSMPTGVWESLVVVLMGLVFASLSAGWTCWIRSLCVSAGTCRSVSGSSLLFQCGFENVIGS